MKHVKRTLRLRPETVRHLTGDALGRVVGGGIPTEITDARRCPNTFISCGTNTCLVCTGTML